MWCGVMVVIHCCNEQKRRRRHNIIDTKEMKKTGKGWRSVGWVQGKANEPIREQVSNRELNVIAETNTKTFR